MARRRAAQVIDLPAIDLAQLSGGLVDPREIQVNPASGPSFGGAPRRRQRPIGAGPRNPADFIGLGG